MTHMHTCTFGGRVRSNVQTPTPEPSGKDDREAWSLTDQQLLHRIRIGWQVTAAIREARRRNIYG